MSHPSTLTHPFTLERLDGWAGTCMTLRNPGQYVPTGSVFRGFQERSDASAYAREVAAFFGRHGMSRPVFVVRGPTSTTRMPYEVVDASCGYSILEKVRPIAAAAPSAGLKLRTVIACFGLEAVRGLGLTDGSGRVLYVSDRCLDSNIALYAESPSEAFRIHRLYGAESRDAPMVEWIDTNTASVCGDPPRDEDHEEHQLAVAPRG